MNQDKRPRWYSELGHFWVGRAKVVVLILAGFLSWRVGGAIDDRLGTQPWVMTALFVLCLGVATYYFYQWIKNMGFSLLRRRHP